MVRNILLLLLAYTFVPPSVRPSTPVVDVVKTRDTKAFLRNCCCKRRPSFWSCVFWALVIRILIATVPLEAALRQSVKNSLAVLTLGQRGLAFLGYMMHRVYKHRVPGVSRLMASLRCGVVALLQELTPHARGMHLCGVVTSARTRLFHFLFSLLRRLVGCM